MTAIVDHIDISELPDGQRTDLWLHIADDQVGLPIRLPVIAIKGSSPGPVIGLTAAVHGDEVNGIAVIHRLSSKLDPTKLSGAVVAIPVVNVPAFRHHQRRMLEGVDLNHEFPGAPDGPLGDVYAHRLLTRAIAKFDQLIDLHTASRGRANCLYVRADLTDPATARMARLQRPQIILHNPPSDGTLRGAAAELGVHAITVEVGNPSRFQKEIVRRTVIGVRSVLAEAGVIKARPAAEGAAPLICSSSRWLYTDAGGLLDVFPSTAEHVEKGQPIARLVDVFGGLKESIEAPDDGVIIGKSTDPVAATGARIVHLGRLATPDSDLLVSH